MPASSILYPAFAHVLLTIVVMLVMAARRAASMREKKHTYKDVGLGQDVWAVAATKAARNYSNQFEMPVFFHAACVMAVAARVVDQPLVWLAWAFVAARVVHAIIHVTFNNVPQRAAAFIVSALITLAMWVVLVMRVA
jgi:hypothetical protein